MVVKRYQDLETWQLTEEFKAEVFSLVRGSAAAMRNFTFRDQILNAAGAPSKHVAEGFLRNNPGEFCRFLDYAISSVGETENHLIDGSQHGYFPATACAKANRLAYRCTLALLSLKRSQERYLAQRREAGRLARKHLRGSGSSGSRNSEHRPSRSQSRNARDPEES